MKKASLFTMVAVFLMLPFQLASAQERGVIFSVVAALNTSNIVGDSESWKTAFGPGAGLVADIFRSSGDVLHFRPELDISMQGAKWEEDWGQGLTSGRTSMLYVNLPLVMRYQHASGFFAEIGLQPGLLVSAKDKYDGNTDDYMEWLNKFDFGIPLGIGYELKNKLGIGLRVVPGLANINSEDEAVDHNLVAALRVSYTFRKK